MTHVHRHTRTEGVTGVRPRHATQAASGETTGDTATRPVGGATTFDGAQGPRSSFKLPRAGGPRRARRKKKLGAGKRGKARRGSKAGRARRRQGATKARRAQRRAGTQRPQRSQRQHRDPHAGHTHGSSTLQPTGKPASGDWRSLKSFAEQRGFHVTSTTGGGHNTGSAHYQGRAVDVRTRDKSPAQVEQLIREARAAGYIVHDERRHPPGQRVWSGPHIHLEIPRRR